MYSHINNNLQKKIVTIHPGEYFCSNENIIIATVLGSCIAVALYDEQLEAGGLNHFMLPSAYKDLDSLDSIETGKYGMYAMELLINDLIKLGVRKSGMRAKVFGGGSVLNTTGKESSRIAKSNIDFALSFLRLERIPIVSQDIGGTSGRKIFFYPRTSRVLLKRLSGNIVRTVERQERKYLEELRTKRHADGNFTIFDP